MNKQRKQDLIKTAIGLGLIAGVVLISRASSAPVGPLYPSPGTETILNEPGHYIGWFATQPPGSLHPYEPPIGWVISNWETGITGSHGGCPDCTMFKLELVWVGE